MTTTSHADRQWLLAAIELSRKCPPTNSAYSVGAIIVGSEGVKLAEGYSREGGPHDHAEQSAIAKLGSSRIDLTNATIYSSLEPCSTRKSQPRTCTQLILAAGIGRVVYALREPPLFAECHGVELLRDGGVQVIEISALGQLVRDINARVLGTGQR
ncbi:MAG: dCMP deaminase [Egibacteraceae bacterium]